MRRLKRDSISEQVFQQLKEKIIKGDWEPGSKIPSENQLCEILGVSRVSIREAIHKLVALGILEVRHGEGTFVRDSLAESYFNEMLPFFLLDRPDIIKILEYRKIVEVGTIGIALQKATQDDIKRLEEIYHDMEKNKDDLEKFAQLDLKFHMALAHMADNPILNKVNYIINDILEETMKKIVERLGNTDGLYYHIRIIEAIKAEDVTKAQQLMAEHLDRTIEKMSTQK